MSSYDDLMNLRKSEQTLLEIQQKFNQFDGKDIKDVRNRLYSLIVNTVKKHDLYREDEKSVVNLYRDSNKLVGPEISIGIDKSNKVWICDDGLWGTVFGINEQIQEIEAYRSESKMFIGKAK